MRLKQYSWRFCVFSRNRDVGKSEVMKNSLNGQSMNGHFLTWFLIGWQHKCYPIRIHTRTCSVAIQSETVLENNDPLHTTLVCW